MTREQWEKEKELSRNQIDEEEENIPTDIDELMTYNGVNWSDFI